MVPRITVTRALPSPIRRPPFLNRRRHRLHGSPL